MKLFKFIFLIFVVSLVSILSFGQNRSGKYILKYKNEVIGVIKIKEVRKRKQKSLSFDVQIGQPETTCVGGFSGKARQLSSNLFEYNSSDSADTYSMYCRLTFSFAGNKIILREAGCDDFHGARCSFDGEYTRSKARKK
jgi:hypothetical protein